MTPASAGLEQALQRHGDDLYRLSLLLTRSAADAAQLLTRAVTRLARNPAAPTDEAGLLRALVDALPLERPALRRAPLPEWASRASHPADARRLAALAALPRRERLALGLTILRAEPPEQIAPLLESSADATEAIIRAALLAVAPHVPEVNRDDLAIEGVPDGCRETREALADGWGAALPAQVRGHLSVCQACRSAEQSWELLRRATEESLRGALRDERLPEELAVALRARLTEPAPPPWWRGSPRQLLWRALLPLGVAAVILALVLPRTDSTPGSEPAPAAAAPRELVERALDTLYAPPPDVAAWHGRWEIRWSFADGSSTLLHADAWYDAPSDRHRLQLVHQAGGGPYEFQLRGTGQRYWYAVSESYAPSVYPLGTRRWPEAVMARAPAGEADRLVQARLDTGAWAIARSYLRQALDAGELSSWGRQRGEDGAPLEVIGFRGYSPLAPPPDAPDAPPRVNVLLTIDAASGALRSVSELVGPAGGEQTGRTTWRFVGGQALEEQAEIARAFDFRAAWNGMAAFVDIGPVGAPELPILSREQVASPLEAIYHPGLVLPGALPPGTTRAVLSAGPPDSAWTAAYFGPGRRLFFQSFEQGQAGRLPPARAGETLEIGSYSATLRAGPAQRYDALVDGIQADGGGRFALRVGAAGYTRAELVEVLRSLEPFTLDSYWNQAESFITRRASAPAAVQSLVRALPALVAPAGDAHLIRLRQFTRHGPVADPLADPYHRAPYGGLPEDARAEHWYRRVGDGQVEVAQRLLTGDGQVVYQAYYGPGATWRLTAREERVEIYDPASDLGLALRRLPNGAKLAAMAMIWCGGLVAEVRADGSQVVSRADPDWQRETCQDPSYPSLRRSQRGDQRGAGPIQFEGPYLVDVSDQAVTTRAHIAPDGRLMSIDIRAGLAPDGVVLQSWDIEVDGLVPQAEIPDGIFAPAPPAARYVDDNRAVGAASFEPRIETITVSETLQLARTPLYVLPDDDPAVLTLAQRGVAPAGFQTYWVDAPFEGALRSGIALQLTYAVVVDSGQTQLVSLYQGPAQELAPYLRRHAIWRSSEPLRVAIGGRPVDGWLVEQTNGARLFIAELDGTLIAASADSPAQLAAIARLTLLE